MREGLRPPPPLKTPVVTDRAMVRAVDLLDVTTEPPRYLVIGQLGALFPRPVKQDVLARGPAKTFGVK